uniref:C-type lectin domain-containing protein n=1 Tax=Zonotrichia albicollis TaxID=44394 RepID=A0A8D2M7U7_ZONAL
QKMGIFIGGFPSLALPIPNPDFSPRFWREGEPNDSGNNEDCAHLWISGKWNDVHCTFECFFVCERPLAQKSPFSH